MRPALPRRRPRPHDDVAHRVGRGDDDGASVAPGERGEIVMRGPKVFKGYWRDPAATEQAFAGGWFHTGDVGVRDEDGYLFIVDRLKDMIISGGENIAGSEVERVLYEHDAVLEVAVVGRPDERWGEVTVGHRSPGRAERPRQQQPEVAALHVGERRCRRREHAEAEVVRVEVDAGGDVVDQVADVDGLVGCHGTSSGVPGGELGEEQLDA